MAADASKGYQIAEVTLAQFSGELEQLAVERAAARARRHRDQQAPAPEDFTALTRDLLATLGPSIENATSTLDPGSLARKLRRMRAIYRYLSVESSVWVGRARRQAWADGDVGSLLELCHQRDALARERGASSWLDLLLDVMGVQPAELDRIDDEMRRELERAHFAEALAESEDAAGDPEHTEETCWVPPRTVGEFLGRLGLGEFWERLVTEPAPAFAGAEALPVGGAGDARARVFVGEEEGHVPARPFLGAVGAALHDASRPTASPSWCVPELSILRGAMARFFARYHDRAGWQVAYCNLDYDIALRLEAACATRAARKLWWRHGVASWAVSLHRERPQSAAAARERLLVLLGLRGRDAVDPADHEAQVTAAVRCTLERPAVCTWMETVIAENLFAGLAAPPDATIDNPAVGRMLPELLGRPDDDPWDARLEVMRGARLTGKLRPTLPGKHGS